MAVPSKEEFYSFVDLVHTIDASSLAGRGISNADTFVDDGVVKFLSERSFIDELLDKPTAENIEVFFNKVLEIIGEKDSLRVNHPVQVWLDNQLGFKHGVKAVFPVPEKEIKTPELVKLYVKEALSILKSYPLDPAELKELNSYLHQVSCYKCHQWLYDFVFKLQLYYYPYAIDEQEEKELEEYDDEQTKRQKEVLNSVGCILDYLNSRESCAVDVRQREEGIEALERLHDDFDVAIKMTMIDDDDSVINKKDKTSRERKFIYNLWQLLRTPTSRGVPAIVQFLSLEGVENQLDPRTIHRMIERWEKQEVKAGLDRTRLAERYPKTEFTKDLMTHIY